MIDLDMHRIVPRFLLDDINGFALSEALRVGMTEMMRVIDEGIDCVLNVDTMPEWRLDEMAYETDILYDYTADIDDKREWIRSAIPIYRYYGTPYAIKSYLRDMLGEVAVVDSEQPYHFSVKSEAAWSTTQNEFALKTIERVKNLRSVLDGIGYTNSFRQNIYYGFPLVISRKYTLQMEGV